MSSILKEYINEIFLENDEEDEIYYAYHVTTLGRISNIIGRGLGGGSSHFSNYGDYSAGRNFLTDHDGVSFWFERVSAHAEANSDDQKVAIPVVLRIDISDIPEEDFQDDEIGSRDSRSDSFIYEKTIQPDMVEVFTGSDYIPLEELEGMDDEELLDLFSEMYEIQYEEDEDGEELEYVFFNLPSGY